MDARGVQVRWGAWALAFALAAPCAAQGPVSTWGSAAPVAAGAPVIATSRPIQPGLPAEARLRPPDDGLLVISPARLAQPVAKQVAPRPIPSVVVHAAHSTPSISAVGSALQVEAHGPATATLGQPLSCTVRVRNVGTNDLGSVRIVLPLPSGAKLIESVPAAEREPAGLAWAVGSMRPGAEQVFRVDVLPPDAAALRLSPVATFAATTSMQTTIVRPPLAVSAKCPETVTVGEKAWFAIQVTNNTSNTLRRVYLSCRLPAGLSHPQGQFIEAELPGELAPGQTREERLEATCDRPGRALVHFAAKADGGLAAQGNAALIATEPALVMEVTGPRGGTVGQQMEYRISVRNPGQVPIAPSSLSLPLPEGVEFVSGSEGGQFNTAMQSVSWNLPMLAPQGRCVSAVKVRARKHGDWALAGSVTASGTRVARHTCAVRVENEPGLTMDLSRLDDPLAVGQESSYEVRVYNAGPGAAAQLQVKLELPTNLLPVEGGGPVRWRIQGQTVTFDPVEKMPGKMDAIYKVRVRAVSVGMGRFRATTSAVGLTAPMVREATANVK